MNSTENLYSFYAMTSFGLEDVLTQELNQLGLKAKRDFLGARFEGDFEACVRANIGSRIATRILMEVKKFKANNNDELYRHTYDFPFETYFSNKETIRVNATVQDSFFKDNRFVGLKVKDAIVDRFRDQTGERPSVAKDNPDIVIHVRVVHNEVVMSFDTSGESLSQRGYREMSTMAPLREHLAAGLLALSGWNKEVCIVDPMCGSGTFVIEAALQALNKFPALDRKKFGFHKLSIFDSQVWKRVANEFLDIEKSETTLKFYGYDTDRQAIAAAKTNAEAAGVAEFCEFRRFSVQELIPPVEKGFLILNPPYGERLVSHDIQDSYRDLGFALKNHFRGWTCWVISGNKDLVGLMGLKSTARIPVWNGPIECRFLKYEINK